MNTFHEVFSLDASNKKINKLDFLYRETQPFKIMIFFEFLKES